ncbi:alpha/beta fold hydrolase [Marisediminicola sp. LYQ134]|uniref:alpha/beta fold hydrolase n=1 Tax=Marisediminicola sp. LYQ134 TaxID=3391061 RepID=UPI0039833CDC
MPLERKITARLGDRYATALLSGPEVVADDSPVFVLLHGIGMSHRYFRRLTALLGECHRVVEIDLPGYAFNRTPRRSLSIRDHAEVVAAIIRRADLTHVTVVGHSMGAQFATEVAILLPDRVDGVVLLGPVGEPRKHMLRDHVARLAADTIVEHPVANAIVFTDYVRAGPIWYSKQLRPMLDYDFLERIPVVTQRVLVVRGARDPIATTDWCTRLARTAREGRFVEIDGSAHVVQYSAAAALADLVVDFASS